MSVQVYIMLLLQKQGETFYSSLISMYSHEVSESRHQYGTEVMSRENVATEHYYLFWFRQKMLQHLQLAVVYISIELQ